MIEKLQATYGNIESRETVMKKFHNCTQQPKESVTRYTTLLEEYFDRAVQLGAMHRQDTITLNYDLYQGLHKELKHLSTSKCDIIQDYDIFKIELRKLESEVDSEKQVENQQQSCKVAINTEKVNSKEREGKRDEMKELMKQLNDRFQKLEEKDHKREEPQNLGRGHGRALIRGYRGVLTHE